MATGRGVKENRPVLITGPTGIGKTWLACALGNQAAREGHSVLYTRLTRLLDDLATARLTYETASETNSRLGRRPRRQYPNPLR
ncbi:DNA replication protein DnaC [Azospirillum sp. OGB3]|nr:DNA replication protein DnaC [Azospirillum sp. OGB3]